MELRANKWIRFEKNLTSNSVINYLSERLIGDVRDK